MNLIKVFGFGLCCYILGRADKSINSYLGLIIAVTGITILMIVRHFLLAM